MGATFSSQPHPCKKRLLSLLLISNRALNPGNSPGKRDFHSELYLWEEYIWLLPTDFPGGSDSKASAYNSGDPDSVPGSGRSPAERKGNPLQYSCLENPMDRGSWWAIFHEVTKNWTRLSTQGILKQWYQQHPALLITICLVVNKKEDSLLLLLLSHFSRVQLCVTP